VRAERGVDGVGDDRGAGERSGEGVADVVLQAAVDDDRLVGLPIGGELVRKLYGHFDSKLSRARIRKAFAEKPAAPTPLRRNVS
jgi:hypothetical protein